jgi:hypothetical protein
VSDSTADTLRQAPRNHGENVGLLLAAPLQQRPSAVAIDFMIGYGGHALFRRGVWLRCQS